MQIFRWAICFGLVAIITGCGGIPTREEIADRIAAAAIESVKDANLGNNDDRTNVQVFEAAKDEVDSISNTAFDEMPTSGTARFAGAAQLTLTPPGDGRDARRYVGRANVGIDFASEGIVGRIDQFTRRENGRDVSGRLSIRNGDFGVNRPNDFEADYSGNLTENGNTIVVDGRMLGDFKGTPVRGLSVRHNGPDASWNGRNVDLGLGMFLERQ